MNFGTLAIIDGTSRFGGLPSTDGRRGMVRIGGALAPPPGPDHIPEGVTFLVELRYAESANWISGGSKVPVGGVMASYSKSFKRLASGGNPLKDAKNFVSQFSGCDEAHKLRKRVIALSRRRKSISGEEFRFPLGAP